jgi:hypothetical protein
VEGGWDLNDPSVDERRLTASGFPPWSFRRVAPPRVTASVFEDHLTVRPPLGPPSALRLRLEERPQDRGRAV